MSNFNLNAMVTRTVAVALFSIAVTSPTLALANSNTRGTETELLGSAVLGADPSFIVGGVTYGFSPADCDPATAGDQACANPIQASIDFLSGIVPSSPWFGLGATPDDGTIHVEDGTYTEDISIDGAAGWASGANKPLHLGIVGAGSGSVFVDGAFAIANMNEVTLSGFSVKDVDVSGNIASITAHDNGGTLDLTDIIVVSIDPGLNPSDHIGDGIYVIDHAGDISLTDVNASNNSDAGAWIDNRAGLGMVSIQSSTFDANSHGLIVYSNADIILNDVSASNNLLVGANMLNCNYVAGLVCTSTGNISITSSSFNNNNQPGVSTSHSSGLVVESNGQIHLTRVTAQSNDNDGALLVNYFEGSTGSVLVERSDFIENGQAELGSGLDIRSRGRVRIEDVDSERNLEYGVDVYNGYGGAIADIRVRRGHFNENGLSGIRLAANGATDVVGATINGNATLGDINKGLEVYSVGDITVSRVTADDNHGWGARLDNSTGEGTLIVESSEFNGNAVCGVCAYANGNITFFRVTASHNGASGANLDNCGGTGLACPRRGKISVGSSHFDNNGPVGVISPHWIGFVAYSNQDIMLTNVSANSNNYHGALLLNYFDGSTGRIIVRRSEFNDNGTGGELGDGLKLLSRGVFSLSDVTANRNFEMGIEGDNTFGGAEVEIRLSGGQFKDNGVAGLSLGSLKQLTLSGIVLENNRRWGANLFSPDQVTVSCSAVLNHRDHIGIKAETPLLSLNGVRFAGNGTNYTSTGSVVIRPGCR